MMYESECRAFLLDVRDRVEMPSSAIFDDRKHLSDRLLGENVLEVHLELFVLHYLSLGHSTPYYIGHSRRVAAVFAPFLQHIALPVKDDAWLALHTSRKDICVARI